jgi:hypothetical protein
MRWSHSASRSFRKCQRQWYFKNIVANAKAKEPLRRRAYLLSKLQSVSAWRGKIVDDVISKTIVPDINRRSPIILRDAKARARQLYDAQLAFALAHPINDPDLNVSDEGEEFCLFYAMEYGPRPSGEELEQAWSEIDQALSNLYTMDAVREPLKAAEYVIAQRPLQFELMDGITALCYPDAIAFRKKDVPVIVDWKVHAFGEDDAWLQLAVYAIALSRLKHKDFPVEFSCNAENVLLLEAQLLTESVREHRLDSLQIEDAEEYIISSAYEMSCLTDGKKHGELSVDDFTPAIHAETCQSCPFRALCWEDAYVH